MSRGSHRRQIVPARPIHPVQPASAERLVSQTFSMMESGPLPSPATLKAYDLVLPGLAEMIIQSWQKQQAHRRDLERTVIHGDNQRATLGVICGTGLSVLVLGLCALLSWTNNVGIAAALATFDVAALAGVFVYGTRSRRAERDAKAESMHTDAGKRK